MWWVQLFRVAVLALSMFGVASCSAQPASCPQDAHHVVIAASSGNHCFGVDIADSSEEWARGLMYVHHMENDRGMLFLFDRIAEQSFWMKDTYISLDIVFIGPDGRVSHIAARTEPLNEDSIPSAGPVAAVLEINGGLAEKLGVTVGDRVRHPALGTMAGEEDRP